MIDGHSVLGVVPARGGSKGLPRKNLRLLGGRPLVTWPVRAAIESGCVDRVIVSTDDAEIAAAAEQAGAGVPFVRPAELASDTATSAAVIRHAIESLAGSEQRFDYVLMLEPTSPLTEGSDVRAALERLHANRAAFDAIVGVSRIVASHPEFAVRLSSDGRIVPFAARDFSSLKRRQDIEELYFLDGSLYGSSVRAFLERGAFYHERTLGYAVPRWKSLEVDELLDLVCIEAVLQHRDTLRQMGE